MLDKFFPGNEHRVDRALRILLGVALLAIVFIGPRTPWGLLGVIPLVTGLIGSCPLYALLGVSTCPMKRTVGTGRPIRS